MSDSYYYTDENRNAVGPVSLDELLQLQGSGKLRSEALIWKEGMPDWKPVRTVLPNIPPAAAHGVTALTPPPASVKKPASYLVHSILVTLFCCLPFGIVAIVMSSRVDSLYYAGRYQEAENASRSALMWGQIGFFVSVGFTLLLFLVGTA